MPPLGHCYWALAPYSPRPPFRLYGEKMEPKSIASAEPFVDAARRGMSEFVVLTPVKARPVLVITPVLPEYDEVLALRLRRFEKLSSDTVRQQVRDRADPALFHMRPDRFPGLPVENAAIVTSLLRIPAEALDRRQSLGSLDENELRVLHGRVVSAHGLKLDMLVLERAQALIAKARADR
ncbi:MAG TPA: hypothetical protein VGF15_03955 [Solirubrobacteraceae bacterium]